jgi:predicted GIY-YIG superfamily endonuclease
MNENEIIKEIDKRINQYSAWTIGITNDPKRRKKENDNPQIWNIWQANTHSDAERVEQHFRGKGMKGASVRGEEDSKYVYVFKA